MSQQSDSEFIEEFNSGANQLNQICKFIHISQQDYLLDQRQKIEEEALKPIAKTKHQRVVSGAQIYSQKATFNGQNMLNHYRNKNSGKQQNLNKATTGKQQQKQSQVIHHPHHSSHQSLDTNSIKKKKGLKIMTNIDDNYKITSEASLVENDFVMNQKENNQHIVRGDQIVSLLLDTYDKDYEEFNDHIEKIKNSTRMTSNDRSHLSNKENIVSSKSQRTLHTHQNSIANKLMSPKKKTYQLQTDTLGSPKVLINLESNETSKRHSGVHQILTNPLNYQYSGQSTSTVQGLKDYTNKIVQDSQVLTERRGDQKLIIKLKNDIQFLNELLEEEKDKTQLLNQKVKFYEEQIIPFQQERQSLIERINVLEEQLKESKCELQETKLFYEEMMSNLQNQLQHLQAQNTANNRAFNNLLGLSKIEKINENKNNGGLDQSSIFFKKDDETIKELGFEFSPKKEYKVQKDNNNTNALASIQQNGQNANKLKGIIQDVSYQNKQNNFFTLQPTIQNNRQQILTDLLSPSFNNVKNSQLGHFSTNHSNIMITSDILQTEDNNVSHTISQLDNFNNNVKLLRHFNKTLIGDDEPLQMTNGNINLTNRQAAQQILQQSSILDYDDSIICEEAEINVNQIKTTNFGMKRVPEEQIQMIQRNIISLNQVQQNDPSTVEDQINLIIHQIEQEFSFRFIFSYSGYLLQQTNGVQNVLFKDFKQPTPTININLNSRRSSNNCFQNNLATFGGGPQAASLAGTQQLNELWNDMMPQSSRRQSSIGGRDRINNGIDDLQISNDQTDDQFNESQTSVNQQQLEESLRMFKERLAMLINK